MTFIKTVLHSAGILALAGSLGLCAAGQKAAAPARAHASAWARARALVHKMTLREKIEELHGTPTRGHFRHIVGIPRLGIPELRLANGCVGVGPADDRPQKPATALPASIALAAAWSPRLARQYGVLMGAEARDLNYGMLEGPDINIARVPQNGRTFEAYGEDPFLDARIAVPVVEGVQSQHVIAEVKHYDANNQETDRFQINEIIPLRALHEIYLPAFKATVEQAHVAAVMCAYPRINGTFNCQNPYLLKDTLWGRWHFHGFVTSDFGATHSTVRSALNGLDVEMPNGHFFGKPLYAAVKAGKVPISVINHMLEARFSTMIRFGLFNHPPVPRPIPVRRDAAIALHIAEQGMVLLKNSGDILPLQGSQIHSLALIGPYAVRAMTGGGGSSHVVPIITVKPLAGLRALAPHAHIVFNNGSNPAQAARIARAAQIAIVMVGDHETEGHDHPISLIDGQNALIRAVAAANPRTIVVMKSGSAILMPWLQQVPAVLEAWYPGEEDGAAVAAVLFGKVNPSGKLPLTFPRTLAQLPAHTPAQYPGVPVPGAHSARLPFFHYLHQRMVPMQVHYSEGVFVGYRYYDARHEKPLFPFGFGLSYTAFAFHHLHVARSILTAGSAKTLRVSFDVTNTGHRAGAEVAQLYLGYPSSAQLPEPPRQLRGFKKVFLAPGQTRRVTLSVPVRLLRAWNPASHSWQPLYGYYRVLAGGSSAHLPLRATVWLRKK